MKLTSNLIIAISLMITSTTVFLACEKTISNEEQNKELGTKIKEFTLSREFNRALNAFPELGDIDIKNSSIEIIKNNGKEASVLKVYFIKNNTFTGYIEGIKMNSEIVNIIPNNDRYLMTLIKYDNYNFKTMTGNVQMYDLNYDNFKYASLTLEKGHFKTKIVSKLPFEISTKYQSLTSIREYNSKGAKEKQKLKANHFCDENDNGNVGYFECVGCFLNACSTSNVCTGMCFLTAPYCGGSIGAACVYLSMAY